MSGGLDSATVLAIAKSEGYALNALSFSYGQRHAWELEAAKRVAASIGVAEHRTVVIDLRAFGGSALTANIEVPRGRTTQEMTGSIPITYVPARNTIFLAYALAWAEVLGANDIYLGVNALDYSGYPDCRPEYVSAFEKMANLATRAGVEGQSDAQDSYAAHRAFQSGDHPPGARSGRGLRFDQQLLRSHPHGRALRPVRLLSVKTKGLQVKMGSKTRCEAVKRRHRDELRG
ncbi:MAG: 7-cyano-7-deazaguanine synthase QueC [Terracidiphilus sp.]